MLLSIVKCLLDFITKLSSQNLIETIIFCMIVVSFTYTSLLKSLIESDFFKLQEIDFIQIISYPNINKFVFLSKSDSISQASQIRLNQFIIKTQKDDESITSNQPINFQKNLKSFTSLQELFEKGIYVSDGTNKLYYNDDLCHKFPEDSLCFSLTSSALEINITKPFCQPSSFSPLLDLNCD
ncbi:3-hydroxy-3-methylglutaryl-coenzyme A reductase [Gigaspora margarita]|uniref:3-hydroxy-3-methylglutaryl-coenzyme A reductase n=1 Tax=Gigaspora margarita TaxID=4874 RepID=A0A8H4ATG4_GIGMA|nr:3-hydroxy-3-methylglutaryl-coenzyme A reductase [Gigaspora margarita]